MHGPGLVHLPPPSDLCSELYSPMAHGTSPSSFIIPVKVQKQMTTDHQTEEELGRPKKPTRNKYAIACAVLASTTSVLLGYDTGVMSGASKYIKRDLKLTDVQIEILVGIINICSIFGSLVAGRTSDWIGRRYTIVLACIIFFLGALLMGLAPSYAFLIAGRVVAGIGVGYALMIAPVYTAEVSPAASRGFLTTFPEVFINFGVLLGYLSNFAFSKLRTNLGWRVMLGAGAVPPIFLVFTIFILPESPRWLVMRGRLKDAKLVLAKTSLSQEEADARLSDIKSAAGIPHDCNDDVVSDTKLYQNNSRLAGERGVWRELLISPSPAVRHILIAGIGIHFFQQAAGVDAVVLYSPRIFEKAGIRSDHQQLLATVAVGFVKTTFILPATFLLDRTGRRPMLLTSLGGMILSLTTLAVGLTAVEHSDHEIKWAVGLCVAAVLSVVAFFSIGMGPVAWVYSSEIYPLRLRALGCSLGAGMNRVISGVIGMTFLSLYKAISIGGAFFLFAGISTVAWVFFYLCLPETRGRTLEEMSELFGQLDWKKQLKKKTTTATTSNQHQYGDDHQQLIANSEIQLATSYVA